MLLEILVGAAVIVALFLLAASREMHRNRMLQTWLDHHPEARRHRAFAPAEHPDIPAAELVENIIGRPPIGFASAFEVDRPTGVLWLVEYRTTPTGAKSSHWFTMVAWQAADEVGSSATARDLRSVQPDRRALARGRWVCQARRGLVTTAALQAVLEDFPGTA